MQINVCVSLSFTYHNDNGVEKILVEFQGSVKLIQMRDEFFKL